MAIKRTKIMWTSPIGTAVYPRVNEPSYKFKEKEGQFSMKLRIVDPADVLVVREHLDAFLADNLKAQRAANKGKNVKASVHEPYTMEIDDNGNETGAILVSASLLHKIKPKSGTPFQQRPALFDAKGKPINPKAVVVGGGSKCRMSCEVYGWWTSMLGASVSLRLRAVQVFDLQEYSGPDASAYGFGSEEGGYEFSEPESSDASSDAGERGFDGDESTTVSGADSDPGDF